MNLICIIRFNWIIRKRGEFVYKADFSLFFLIKRDLIIKRVKRKKFKRVNLGKCKIGGKKRSLMKKRIREEVSERFSNGR